MSQQTVKANFVGNITRVEDKGQGVVVTVEVARGGILRGVLRDLINKDWVWFDIEKHHEAVTESATP